MHAAGQCWRAPCTPRRVHHFNGAVRRVRSSTAKVRGSLRAARDAEAGESNLVFGIGAAQTAQHSSRTCNPRLCRAWLRQYCSGTMPAQTRLAALVLTELVCATVDVVQILLIGDADSTAMTGHERWQLQKGRVQAFSIARRHTRVPTAPAGHKADQHCWRSKCMVLPDGPTYAPGTWVGRTGA